MSNNSSSQSPPQRDYSRSDYAPRDPHEIIYDFDSSTFSYKRRSKVNHAKAFNVPFPKWTKQIRLRSKAGESRIVELPTWVRVGRILGKFERIWVVGD